jgi:hypothetical protein
MFECTVFQLHNVYILAQVYNLDQIHSKRCVAIQIYCLLECWCHDCPLLNADMYKGASYLKQQWISFLADDLKFMCKRKKKDFSVECHMKSILQRYFPF